MDQGEEMDQGGSYEVFDGPMDQKATKSSKAIKVAIEGAMDQG